ncbi:JHE-like carboxylesterase 1 [Penaeus vannamei]|uniref:JHE-like carboxylesterase 1 n=1 Tax=Penaeus vannamei TaxID=6689 RepID=A0A3R7Q4U6_PENVA|nr:JHE-like carboxylesterase 1 [Penaeus vannamei]
MQIVVAAFLLAALSAGDALKGRDTPQQESPAGDEQVAVRLPQGTILTRRLEARDGSPYYPLMGVPYAKAPVGRLRFKVSSGGGIRGLVKGGFERLFWGRGRSARLGGGELGGPRGHCSSLLLTSPFLPVSIPILPFASSPSHVGFLILSAQFDPPSLSPSPSSLSRIPSLSFLLHPHTSTSLPSAFHPDPLTVALPASIPIPTRTSAFLPSIHHHSFLPCIAHRHALLPCPSIPCPQLTFLPSSHPVLPRSHPPLPSSFHTHPSLAGFLLHNASLTPFLPSIHPLHSSPSIPHVPFYFIPSQSLPSHPSSLRYPMRHAPLILLLPSIPHSFLLHSPSPYSSSFHIHPLTALPPHIHCASLPSPSIPHWPFSSVHRLLPSPLHPIALTPFPPHPHPRHPVLLPSHPSLPSSSIPSRFTPSIPPLLLLSHPHSLLPPYPSPHSPSSLPSPFLTLPTSIPIPHSLPPFHTHPLTPFSLPSPPSLPSSLPSHPLTPFLPSIPIPSLPLLPYPSSLPPFHPHPHPPFLPSSFLTILQDPVRAESWTEPRKGTVPPPRCPQVNLEALYEGRTQIDGEEDCLYLNVFTPQLDSDALLPVIVAFHSGAFELGGTDEHQPLPLVTKGIVLVSVAYRLDALGFLSSEDAALPGNLGLKDQVMGLRWVQDNIRNLGGDPDKVTILGVSAGAASVHYHMLSPMSSGLFHRAVLQSGSSLCPWAFREDHRRVFLAYAHSLGCISKSKSGSQSRAEPSDTESEAVVECLRQVPLDQLLPLLPQFQVWHGGPRLMTPRVDGEFLQDHPATLLREGRFNKVSLISGVTTGEAGLYTKGIWLDKEALAALKTNFDVAGPVPVGFHVWEEDPAYLARRAFYRYMDSTELNDNTLEDFQRLLTDRHHSQCHEDTAFFHAKSGSKVFLYQLQHRGQFSFSDVFNISIGPGWVGHMDDIQYLFYNTTDFQPLQRDADVFVSRIMATLWANFAKTGHPTPDQSLGFRWSPASESDLRHLAINTTPKMIKSPFILKREFWKNLPIKNNKLLYPELFQACSERSPSQWLWTTAPGCEAPRD